MRVLSFIPALLLAATSFVAAAPTVTSSLPVPSCTSTSTGSGNDASLQPIIAILTNATTAVTPLNNQLTTLKGTNNPDIDTASSVIVQITTVVSFTVTQLNTAASVEVNGLDLSSLCSAIYALLTLILSVLNCVVLIVTAVSGSAIITLQQVLTNLLNAVLGLVGCLQIFVTASTSGVLGPVLTCVNGSLTLLLSICAGATVLVGASN